MVAWRDLFRGDVVAEVVGAAPSLDAAVESLSDSTGVPVSRAALATAWSRYAAEHGLPRSLAEYLGSRRSRSARDIDGMRDELRLPRDRGSRAVAKPVTKVEPRDGERWLLISDVHSGIQDDVSIELMLRCAEDFRVDRSVQVGDLYDCYGLSRHDKVADRVRSRCFLLSEEAEETRYLVDWMARTRLPSYVIPGNHEERLWKIADVNPSLVGAVDMRGVFSIPDRVHVLPRHGRLVAGSLVVEHGHKLPTLGSSGPAAVLGRMPDNTTVYGHTHRIAEHRRTTHDPYGRPRTRMALSIGHLSVPAMHVDYAPEANWQQGFALVEFWRGNDRKLRFTIYVVEIHDHEFCFGGKIYR